MVCVAVAWSLVALSAAVCWYCCMCERAFAHFLSLLDSQCWDEEISKLRCFAGEALAEPGVDQSNLPSCLDVVCTGGGFRNCYSAGVIFALQQRNVSLQRFAGASAGAQLAFVMMTGQFEECLRWAMAVASTLQKFPWVRPGPLWDHFYRRCAHRAPVPADGSFVVSVTELISFFPPTGCNHLISSFEDQSAVGDGLLATAAVPFFICRGPWMSWRGMRVLDGGLTNNTPHFRDGVRHQLVITFDSLTERFHGRTCGIYWEAAEMLEVIRWGIEDGVSLLCGRKPPGLRIIEPEQSLEIPPSSPVTLMGFVRMIAAV